MHCWYEELLVIIWQWNVTIKMSHKTKQKVTSDRQRWTTHRMRCQSVFLLLTLCRSSRNAFLMYAKIMILTTATAEMAAPSLFIGGPSSKFSVRICLTPKNTAIGIVNISELKITTNKAKYNYISYCERAMDLSDLANNHNDHPYLQFITDVQWY